jgi:tetratricopeptide (TPR) repeat protein
MEFAGGIYTSRATSIILERIGEEGESSVTRKALLISIAAVCSLLGFCGPLRAQDPPASPSKPPDSAPPPPPTKTKDKQKSDSATKSAADQPTWDPLRAEKDLEVGKYYMKKGDLDAAIDRFEDAAAAKPGFAIPYLYLGEAQEKKGLKKQAAKSYQRYLDLYPHAEDREKVQKKIEKLYAEIKKEKS